MKDYNKVESCLKSFLKNNKRLSYSMALLISFLINGGFSYADEAIQVPLRTEIKTRIEKEQENISQMLKEADESMKDIELKIKKLTQRGEFWVKPLEKSYQGFIFANWGNYSKNKNKTESNFNGPEYSASYGKNMGYGQFSNGKYYGEYGIVKNPLEFVDKIDFGANITPKAVTEKTIVEKTVIKKDITAPSVTPPTVEVGEITLTAPEEVAIVEMTPPNEPNPSVTTPSTVPALQGITVAAVSEVNVTPSTPEVAAAPTINAPTVTPPATPAGFTPRLITPPEVPADIVVTPPTITPPTLLGGGANPQADRYYYWDGNDGAISQVNVTSGTISITGNVTNYSNGNMDLTLNNFHVSAYPGTSPSGTAPTSGTYKLNRRFFNTLLNVPYSEFSSGVTINYNYKIGGSNPQNNPPTPYEGAVINLETEGNVAGNLSTAVTKNQITESKKNILKGYQSYSGITGNDNGATELLFINKGNINLISEKGIYIFTTTHTGGNNRTNYLDNEGTISAKGKESVIIKHTPDTAEGRGWIYSNSSSGKMYADGEGSVIMGWAYKHLQHGRAAFVNAGEIKVRGKRAVGIFMADDTNPNNTTMAAGSSVYLTKPIDLLGDRSMGWVSQNTGVSAGNGGYFVQFNIGNEVQDATLGESEGDGTKVEKAIGILQDHSSKTDTTAVIKIGEHSKGSIGVYGRQGILNITAPTAKDKILDSNNQEKALTVSEIDLQGGADNIGIVASKDGTKPAAEVNVTGDVKISGGTGQKIAIAEKGGKINLKGNVMAGTNVNFVKNAVPLYATGEHSTITVQNSNKFEFYLSGNSTAAYAKDKATINMNRTTLPSEPTIHIKGENGKGIGLFAKDGGVINAQKHYIKVENGSTAISSIGAGSNIDFTGGKLEYTGNGYAVYSDGTGKIDLSDAELNLHGSSTAFDVDLGASTLPTKLNSGTKIKVHSDDVIAFNLKRATGLTTVGGIETSIKSKIETKLGLGSGSLNNLFSGSTADRYKVAAVDGGEITVGNLDKSGTKDDTDQAKKDGYQYFNRFLAQRLKATANGSTIKAVLSSSFANDNFNGQVVGFEMNSSKNATNVDETAINLVNSKIMADRTDAGAGAIGAFINYGLVNIDATSKIEVEKENNVVNKQAVGVYAVNGSKVDNKGTIDVGGDQSVGILGMAYREDASHNPIVKEFGDKATNQGLVNITNEKDIKMSGKDAIGIYAMNNNTDTTVTSHLVTNKGTVEVGDSGEKTAVGIYAKGVNVKPESGKIKIGKKAVGIYAEDSQVGEANKDLGTVDFNGDDGVGIYLKGSGSNLLGNKVTLTQSKDSKNKVGILADRGTSSIIKTEVAVGTLNNVIAYYSKGNHEFNVQSNVTLNENSIGISGEDDLLYGDGTNTYTMKLGKSSTGLFGTKKIGLKDKTNIELNGENSVGAYASGANGVITSEGKIKFLKENSIGLYGAKGATINDKTASMDFTNANAKNNIGVYLAGANWERDSALTFSSTHEKGNIYLFAQGGSEGATDKGNKITLKNIFNVSPSNDPTGNEKTIGMYLDTAVKGKSTYVDNTVDMSDGNAKVSVTKKAIGIYAKNADNSKNNIINTLKVSSAGQGTVGSIY